MDLTEDEALQILNLIEKSSFDFLELQIGDLKLVVSKSGSERSAGARFASSGLSASSAPATAARETKIKPEAGRTEAKQKPAARREGTLPITAPMVGTFYITPEPGAPPFVELGGRVDEDTTVGLIEVMKVFNAVKSGVRGIIEEICVQGGGFVEQGETLFLVKPEGKG